MFLHRRESGGTGAGGADLLMGEAACHMLASLALATWTLAGCGSVQTYKSCATPIKSWLKPSDGIGHMRMYVQVAVNAKGEIKHAGRLVAFATFKTYLKQVSEMDPLPQLILQFDPQTDCDFVRRIRQAMNAQRICPRDRMCGEGTGWRNHGVLGGTYGPIEL